MPVDFSWILFVGVKFLGFSEREVGHMTIKKWLQLYEHYRKYHNFKAKNYLFKEEKSKPDEEWLPD